MVPRSRPPQRARVGQRRRPKAAGQKCQGFAGSVLRTSDPPSGKTDRNGSGQLTMEWSRASVNQLTIDCSLTAGHPGAPGAISCGKCREGPIVMARERIEKTPQSIPVLIVGGGPVGLTASILLSRHGVRSLLAERHTGTAVHPKARAINARSMEIYRQCGVEAAIRRAGLGPEHIGLVVWTQTLAGEEIERRVPWRAGPQSLAISPVRNCLCAQDDLEPVLRAFAECQGPGELRFGTEVGACVEDEDGITATLLDRAGGGERRVRAQYVIAADGAQSGIRRRLGVGMIGHERVYESVNILLNADLRPWTEHRPAALYFVEHPQIKATFLTINARDRWDFLV